MAKTRLSAYLDGNPSLHIGRSKEHVRRTATIDVVGVWFTGALVAIFDVRALASVEELDGTLMKDKEILLCEPVFAYFRKSTLGDAWITR